MVTLPLLNLILQNFLQARIISVAFLSCWDVETQHSFAKLATNNYAFAQYMNIDANTDIGDFVNRQLNHKHPTLGMFLDMNCERSEEIMYELSQRKLFNARFHWLLFDQKANLSNFQNIFANYSLSVDADLTYATPNTQQSRLPHAAYILYDVYNNGRSLGGRLNVTIDREFICNDTSCQLSRYLSDLHLRTKYGNRNRLHDISMRSTTVITKLPLGTPEKDILDFLITENNTRIDGISRFGYHILLIIKDLLGCNMNHTFTDRWSTNETHGGIVGAMATEQADIVSTPFLISAGRLKYCTPLLKTSEFHSICLFRTPRNTGIRGDVFLKPFSGTVWILFVVLLGISALLLWSTFMVEYRRMRLYLDYVPSFLTTCLISFGSACIQGSSIIPSSVGGRMAFFSLYFATFIMYNYYTSIVVSSLLGSPLKSDIKTLAQLADSSLDVGLEPAAYNYAYLNSSPLPEVRRFVKRKVESKKNQRGVWLPTVEGILRVRDVPGFAYVFEASSGYSIVEDHYEPQEICDLNEVIFRPDTSLYTQLHRNSTYKEVTKLRLLRILETGIHARHYRHWVQTHLNCFANNFVIDVGMEYTAPLFFMLMAAYVLVLMLLLIEIFYKRYTEKKKAQLKDY